VSIEKTRNIEIAEENPEVPLSMERKHLTQEERKSLAIDHSAEDIIRFPNFPSI
jgi:hypothetical protein